MAIYNVLDFGATGNDSIDDRVAIQAAVDAAYAAGGGSVYIPAGTYLTTGGSEPSDGCIILRDNVTLYGDGMGQTIIKLVDGWNQKITGILRTEYGVETENVYVHDLTIDGNRANNTEKVDGWFNGVKPGDTGADRNITLERMEVRNMSGYGFDPHERSINLTIRDSVAHHNGLDGFVADFLIDSRFENNVAYANDRHGFNVVTSTNHFVMDGNEAYGNGSTGLTVQRGSENLPSPEYITIKNGVFTDNGRAGIEIKMSNDVILDGNYISGNGSEGIKINGSEDVQIINNTIENNSVSNPNYYAEINVRDYDDSNGPSHSIYEAESITISNNHITQGATHDNLAFNFNDNINEVTLQNNTLQGFDSNGPETIIGTAGNDILRGSGFDDVINGMGGKDTLTGGNGHDIFVFSSNTHSTETALDVITDFTVGQDLIDLSSLPEFTHITTNGTTAPGGLRLTYSAPSDRTYVRSDQSNFEFYLKGNYVGKLDDNDFIFGEGSLQGTNGNDVLVGGAEGDVLNGGAGKDSLTGKGGDDIFVFSNVAHSTQFAPDAIMDFTVGQDLIDLSQLGEFNHLTTNNTTAIGELRLAYSAATDRTYVRSDQSDFEFYLKGNYVGQVTDSDFLL